MALSFESIGQKIVSFKVASSADVGRPCAMCANDTVGEPADDGEIIGVVASIRGELAGVIVSGCVTQPYAGAAPACGYQPLGYDSAEAGVKVITGCKKYLVVNVNTEEKTVTFFL